MGPLPPHRRSGKWPSRRGSTGWVHGAEGQRAWICLGGYHPIGEGDDRRAGEDGDASAGVSEKISSGTQSLWLHGSSVCDTCW